MHKYQRRQPHLDGAIFFHAKAKERGGVDLITEPISTPSLYRSRDHPIKCVPAVLASIVSQREFPCGRQESGHGLHVIAGLESEIRTRLVLVPGSCVIGQNASVARVAGVDVGLKHPLGTGFGKGVGDGSGCVVRDLVALNTIHFCEAVQTSVRCCVGILSAWFNIPAFD